MEVFIILENLWSICKTRDGMDQKDHLLLDPEDREDQP